MNELTPETIAQRVSAATDDPQLVKEIEHLERIAAGRVAYVASNGKFPRWSVERWLAFIGAIISGTLMLIAWIFFAGGQWAEVKADIKQVRDDHAIIRQSNQDMKQQFWELQQELKSIQRVDEWYRKPRGGEQP